MLFDSRRKCKLGGHMARLSLLLVAGLTLAACATAPTNPLTAEQRRDLGIQKVEVSFAPDYHIWWGEAERDFARSKGCEPKEISSGSPEVASETQRKRNEDSCDYSALVNSPEAKAYVETRAKEVLKKHMEKTLMPAFEGPDPAIAAVQIKVITIVSGMQAMLFGGSHVLHAHFEIQDQIDGRRLAQYRDIRSIGGYAPGGLLSIAVEALSDDPYERLSSSLATQAKDWLKGEAGKS